MYKKLKQIIYPGLIALITFSCTTDYKNVSGNVPDSTLIQSASNKAVSLSFKLVKDQEISQDVINLTSTKAKELSDKESKKRGIDLFNLPKNPVGLEIASGKDKVGYILNYTGTSEKTEDLNVEVKALYSAASSIYSLNYSGPVTNPGIRTKDAKGLALSTSAKESGITFELLQGLPPGYIVNTFEDFIKSLNEQLRNTYHPQNIEIALDNVFIYAVNFKGNLIGYFFESHANKVILGERKYADMQIGVMVSEQNKILGNYSLVGFNPKTKLNGSPDYKYISRGQFNILQFGEL